MGIQYLLHLHHSKYWIPISVTPSKMGKTLHLSNHHKHKSLIHSGCNLKYELPCLPVWPLRVWLALIGPMCRLLSFLYDLKLAVISTHILLDVELKLLHKPEPTKHICKCTKNVVAHAHNNQEITLMSLQP